MDVEFSTTPLVSAIMVSFNSRQMTLDALAALLEDLQGTQSEVWVVDNASSDGSADAISARFPQVKLIINDRNLGFGAANNQALERATGEFLLLLNSDAFVAPGTVAALLACMKRHPRAGAVGPRLLNRDG